ncbi:K+ homeostasis protein Kha1 [Paecilomyces variotii No. 5]|uniref:K+ homeostasis protein Kha1 n=1 Tax=Byssochlamys spectabilis (strain No. 5 / NBRC 109023) TaxID=1356009 RepID=V5GGJ2_BYSSN|nr:K+ homeostasis protein Kha1 [Paecilomyces variotii No. 5]
MAHFADNRLEPYDHIILMPRVDDPWTASADAWLAARTDVELLRFYYISAIALSVQDIAALTAEHDVVMMATATSTQQAAASSSNRATPQGGILEGGNPTHYDPKNPITLFIIQAGIIIIFCRLLHWPLSKIRQPRVIAEVIGGILLGPSVMGRIPGFTDAIFPTDSIPNLNLVATLGLVLFLFLVGLETDLRFLARNWRIATSVSALGMILPFGLGSAISYGLYNQFRNEPGLAPITFGTYLLFIGIAMAITAFPVLCRILTELKLLGTDVGVIVLSAGVGNDVVGWILLALCVALVNAGSGLTALWVLLVFVGYTAVLGLVIRPLFLRFLERTGSLQKGPSQSVVAVTLLMALTSAFFTQAIGIHAIFGGFVIGLICPHEGGFAIKLTEKVEDLVSTIFLPLYFALSGLSTNLGLLDSGIVWGYVIAVITIAFVAKVAGGAIASRLAGLLWRESFTIGVLMSCKGLVELIVLNIGFQAKILSQRTFTIFVVMALVTTFATTPLTSWLYPKWYQVKVERWRRGEIDWDGNSLKPDGDDNSSSSPNKPTSLLVQKLVVYLRLDTLPNVCTFLSLLGPSRDSKPTLIRVHHAKVTRAAGKGSTAEESAVAQAPAKKWPLEVHGVRLLELTDRDSSVMKVSEVHEYTVTDPVVNTFRAFGQLNDISMLGGVAVVPERSYADTILDMTREASADLLLIPWSESGSMSELQNYFSYDRAARFMNGPYTSFAHDVLDGARTNVGIFIDEGFGQSEHNRPPAPKRTLSSMSVGSFNTRASNSANAENHHIFFPFLGGDDDRFALRFVLQLAQNDTVTATIVHVKRDSSSSSPSSSPASDSADTRTANKGQASAHAVLHHNPDNDSDNIFFATIRDSLPKALSSRVLFDTLLTDSKTEDPIDLVLQMAQQETGRSPGLTGDIVIVGRRSNHSVEDLASHKPHVTVNDESRSEIRRALGILGEAMVRGDSGIKATVLVLQAGIVESVPSATSKD